MTIEKQQCDNDQITTDSYNTVNYKRRTVKSEQKAYGWIYHN